VPPAWTDVWICADPGGHLQAVGRDARGRKQYRYHPDWRRRRDRDKYRRMLTFAAALPRIRRAVDRDLRRPGITRERVLALVVALLDRTLIRVGNEEYARSNRSYGLTTLRDRHARVSGEEVRFRFTGKSGRTHQVTLRDRRLARQVGRIQELPGQRLFEYLDDAGEPVAVDSQDVNEHLRSIAGVDVTAKDFRTWTATVLAFRALRREPAAPNVAAARRVVKAAMEEVATRLGNTSAVCRTAYVHPVVIDAWQEGALPSAPLRGGEPPADGPPTRAEELAVQRLLRRSCQPRASRWRRCASRPGHRRPQARSPNRIRRESHGITADPGWLQEGERDRRPGRHLGRPGVIGGG
jgi:DNA topoisomerase-1